MSGKRAFLDLLKQEGVKIVFGNPGTTELPIMQALPDYPDLQFILGLQESVVVAMADGFAGLKAKLPPPTRRGVVLIDPPYEIKNDYRLVQDAVREALTRFPDCVVMVWYPQLQTMESQRLPQALKNMAPKSWVHARMTVASADSRGFGMVGSGMVIINPPWKLKAQLEETLPWLTGVLGQVDKPSFLLEHRSV